MKKDAKNTIWQFLKFSVVGVTNTVVDFVVFYLLTRLGVNYIIAQVISYTAGILNSYIWNSFWTFRKERSHTFHTIVMFIVVNVLSLGVSLAVLWLCKNPLGIDQDVSLKIFGKAITIGSDMICKIPASIFSAIANFAGTKLLVFNKETHPEETGDK